MLTSGGEIIPLKSASSPAVQKTTAAYFSTAENPPVCKTGLDVKLQLSLCVFLLHANDFRQQASFHPDAVYS